VEVRNETLPDGSDLIKLVGRMDIAGVQEIDLKFAALTSSRPRSVVVDLSGVSFLASLGIRTLLTSARALARRGGRMVLAAPQPFVKDLLGDAGIEALIPIYADVSSACAGLRASPSDT
jgi:anti-anti-sigma factor